MQRFRSTQKARATPERGQAVNAPNDLNSDDQLQQQGYLQAQEGVARASPTQVFFELRYHFGIKE